jgi:hypothetical protein
MYMSVRIQFHIIDKFIKFHQTVTSVPSLITTNALDILHGYIFRIYEGFLKINDLIFLLYIIYLLHNSNNYKLWRVLGVLNGGCKVDGGPLSNQSFAWLSEFSNTCAVLLHYADERLTLESCKTDAILRAILLLSDSRFSGRSWLSPFSTSRPR